MERTTEQDANFKVTYEPGAVFEYKLYTKGWFGWTRIMRSNYKELIINKIEQMKNENSVEYYK